MKRVLNIQCSFHLLEIIFFHSFSFLPSFLFFLSSVKIGFSFLTSCTLSQITRYWSMCCYRQQKLYYNIFFTRIVQSKYQIQVIHDDSNINLVTICLSDLTSPKYNLTYALSCNLRHNSFTNTTQ